MAINFPSSPTIGQVYEYQSIRWRWNGVAWGKYEVFTFNGLTATSYTAGRILASGFFSSTANTGNSVNILKEALFKFQLERNTFTNTQYELVLAVTASQNTSKVFASMDWEEVSR